MTRIFKVCAAVIAAFAISGGVALAQDVTLTARDGSLALDGTLLSWDGEFYRLDTVYGAVTVDGEGVICEGPACPDLTAPMAVIRVTGAAEAGMRLLPPLVAGFAKARGLTMAEVTAEGATWAADLSDPVGGQVLAKLRFAPLGPDAARAALKSGAAEFAIDLAAGPDDQARVMAVDALVPIVAADNPRPRISTPDLAQALSGKVNNWSQIGGPDQPLVIHALAKDHAVQAALDARLGRGVAAAKTHATLADLAAAVARDPWALAMTVQSGVGAARALPLTDSCGFALTPSRLAVKAEDYPLSLPVTLVSARRRLPLIAREFADFLALPPAQAVVAGAGYVDRAPEMQALTTDGLRIVTALRAASDDLSLADLKALAEALSEGERLSLTFRFEEGAASLDAASRDNLSVLAELIAAGMFKGKQVVLTGFSDGSGDAAANAKLAEERADAVAMALAKMLPDLPADQLPAVQGFGEALPIACDTTVAGRRANRRVETWARPIKDIQQP